MTPARPTAGKIPESAGTHSRKYPVRMRETKDWSRKAYVSALQGPKPLTTTAKGHANGAGIWLAATGGAARGIFSRSSPIGASRLPPASPSPSTPTRHGLPTATGHSVRPDTPSCPASTSLISGCHSLTHNKKTRAEARVFASIVDPARQGQRIDYLCSLKVQTEPPCSR